MTYQEALQFLYHLQIKGMKFGLSSMINFLSLLGNPHQHIKTVHVGGTNGKGSTSAMVASVLSHAGYRVGLYTSPHLIDFSERILVSSFPIPQADVVRLTWHIQELLKKEQTNLPTFFEFVTGLAFLYFLEQKVEIAVIEVGLGGRLDSTNVITPVLSILTNVDFDHQEYLGNTLLEIGFEKAGIIKKGVPLVTGISEEPVLGIVQKTARAMEAPVYRLGVDFNYRTPVMEDCFTNSLDYHGIHQTSLNLMIPLLGEHQNRNASLALAALELLHRNGFPHPESAKRDGLLHVHWPGRIELIQNEPLILLDGAHNPAGASNLVRFLNSLPETGKRFLVLGIMKDKDIWGIGERLIPWADEIILTQASYSRAATPGELLRTLPPTFKRFHLITSLTDVFQYLKSHSEKGDQICLTGSLYTIGEAKAILEGIHIDVPLHG